MQNIISSPGQTTTHPRATLTPRGVERLRSGHLWIFRSDVAEIEGAASGDTVRVCDRRGRPLAWAHYGAESEITLRLVSMSENPPDREFWRARLQSARRLRSRVVDDNADAWRLVHSEGDLLPGLVIDRYGDAFSIQTLTRGMDLLKSVWTELLVEEFGANLIVERNDVKVRLLEGLPMTSGVLFRADPTADVERICSENGLRFHVDLLGGQKTGAFLDQRENREAAMRYGRGRALDCFSFHGSFALHLARVCDAVTAIDVSAPAIERARRNAELNGIQNLEFIEGNVFDELHRLESEGERFDTIVLDPPAFAKNRRSREAALRGYKEINLRALRLLRSEGVLITCSCSYHISESMFAEMLADAARDARRQLQILEKRTQSRDHPILLTVSETHYLKCMAARCADYSGIDFGV
ncbi:MAG: class I SAM-dependent rRNA methyltransferase [Blastocatellales bacterium]|nr:class I SAM-dependent rRNA methyltransferase [Blastocatellales bacterium]